MKKPDRPVKQVKTKFYCTQCHAYLCIKESSHLLGRLAHKAAVLEIAR